MRLSSACTASRRVAPVPNLVDLFAVNIKTNPGKILIAMALRSWAQVYGADLDQIVTRAAQPSVAAISRNCLYNQNQILASVPSALVLGLTFLRVPPWEVEPWKTILEQNTPGAARIGAPVLIVQGDADPIVTPDVTERLAEQAVRRRRNGVPPAPSGDWAPRDGTRGGTRRRRLDRRAICG